MAKTKVAQYILSEAFLEDARQAIAEAVARTRAAGLEPAGDTSVKRRPKPSKVVVIPPPKPAGKRQRDQ